MAEEKKSVKEEVKEIKKIEDSKEKAITEHSDILSDKSNSKEKVEEKKESKSAVNKKSSKKTKEVKVELEREYVDTRTNLTITSSYIVS